MILRNQTTGEKITEFCWTNTTSDVTQVLTKALDGTVYIQVIGEPSKTIVAECVITTSAKPKLESAHARADLMSVTDEDGHLTYGRITALSFQNKVRGNKQRCTVTLAEEEE